MKVFAFLILLSAVYAVAKPIVPGGQIKEAEAALIQAGAETTAMDMISLDPAARLRFWGIDQGVLIINYEVATGNIIRLSYYLSDERPKGLRKVFYFEVASFDPETGQLVLNTKFPEPKPRTAE